MDTGIGFDPVSYTHLDVYKRQPVDTAAPIHSASQQIPQSLSDDHANRAPSPAALTTPSCGWYRSLRTTPARLFVVLMMRVTTTGGHQQLDQLVRGLKLGIVATLWDQGQRGTWDGVYD